MLIINVSFLHLAPKHLLTIFNKTGEYLNFNSHHPYTVKKGIVRCLQHRAKTISSDTDAYQEEMICLRHNLHRNNYPERITSVPRNLDRRMEDNTRKLTTVCLTTSWKNPKDMQSIWHKDSIHKWFNSPEVSLPGQVTNGIQHVQELSLLHSLQLWKNIHRWDRSATKIKAKEHRKAIRGEIEKSVMADDIWKEKKITCPYGIKLK